MSELAAAPGYSQWHAARVFKELTGKMPFDYIRSLRLSKAALELRDMDRKAVIRRGIEAKHYFEYC
jgi:AraC-like DNA-binding protein